MKLTILYVPCICCLVIISCHASNKAATSTAHFRVSPLTSDFINRLKQENPAQPSTTFINDFNLLAINGQYYVSGMATVNGAFDEKKLKHLNIHVNTKAGNIVTLQVPIVNFNQFLRSKGIDYFEVSGRVSIKPQ